MMRIEFGRVGIEASHGSALIKFGVLGRVYVGAHGTRGHWDVWREGGELVAQLGRFERIVTPRRAQHGRRKRTPALRIVGGD